jgi:hypothetical protein
MSGPPYPRDVNLNYPRPSFWDFGRVQYCVKLLPQAHRIRVTWKEERLRNEARYLLAIIVATNESLMNRVLDATRRPGSPPRVKTGWCGEDE